ncbi:MAG: response regulator transcription factor [Verrucomicrobiota bacterium]
MSTNPYAGKRILVIDDEPDVTELIGYRLKQDSYTVEILQDPLMIMGKARDFHPDLFILDIMMPELNGLQICRMIRSDTTLKNTPIIFLTARGDTDDRIKGLETGADDYISKPFNVKELSLRIQSIFKRIGNSGTKTTTQIQVGPVAIDEELHKLTVDGEEVELTATEFRLLKLLMERRGRVQTRENLLINVWNYDSDIETRTVDTHVRRLREKLGEDVNIIETVRGVGYRVIDR